MSIVQKSYPRAACSCIGNPLSFVSNNGFVVADSARTGAGAWLLQTREAIPPGSIVLVTPGGIAPRIAVAAFGGSVVQLSIADAAGAAADADFMLAIFSL